jgi:hypothetical protein
VTVLLLPPVTGGPVPVDMVALEIAPEFVRTAAMSRWHRPRTGVRWPDGRITYGLWDGAGFVAMPGGLAVDTRPDDGLPVCGTCDGRAAGAGQIAGPDGRTLLFTPRHVQPPRWCPGSRSALYEALPGGRVGRCLVCSDMQPLRAMGGPYDGRYAIVQHPPGAALVGPCPFHRWRSLTATAGRVHCTCGRPVSTT